MNTRARAALLVLAAAFAPPAAFAKDARPSLREQILGDEVLMREDEDPAMQAAYARAAATLDDALAVLAAPAPHQSGFSLKVGIAQGATMEYVWIGDIVASSDGQAFEGRAEARAAIKELGLDCDWLQATP